MDLLSIFVSLFLLINLSEDVRGFLGLGGGSKDSSSSSEEETPDVYCDQNAKYRSYDGVCNNLKHPFFGTPGTELLRIVDATSYENGICEPAKLPSCRLFSTQAIPDIFVVDRKRTCLMIMMGQYIAHDMSFTTGATEKNCGCVNGKLTDNSPDNDICYPIKIPCNDPYHGPAGTECFDFTRTLSTCQDDSNHERGEQFNAVPSFLDGSGVYGPSKEIADSLRCHKDGMLEYQMKEGRMYPPEADGFCRDIGTSEDLCIKTGDVRANQNLYIGLIQIIFLRLHNDLAATLCKKNCGWDDEKCYQEARRIVIAIIQFITYHEFLPLVIGKDKVCGDCKGYDNSYDECCNVGVGNEFSAAAFRSLHSIINGQMERRNQEREHKCSLRLSDNLGNLGRLLEKDIELEFATGAATQLQMKFDANYDDELTQYFFKDVNQTLGDDLAATDICRAREHGLAYYIDAVAYCGLGKLKSWDDLKKYIPCDVVDNILKHMYKSYKDVELFMGGIHEILLPGTLTGPTFNCLMVDQFDRLKKCDRYWYSYQYQPYPFTPSQLKSIEKGASIASLVCRYVSGFEYMQRRGFEAVCDSNPLVDCDDIPFIDLDLWANC